MTNSSILRHFALLSALALASGSAHAWFFFLPIRVIARAMETDPDKLIVSSSDRLAGKCAGYHVNQAMGTSKSDDEKPYHQEAAAKAVQGAENKEDTKKLGDAYSARWGRAAQVDMATNRFYESDLASGCYGLNIPLTLAEANRIKAQQEESKRQEEARRREEARRAEEARLAEEAKRKDETARKIAESKTDNPLAVKMALTPSVDFSAEAKKSARILGCVTTEMKVTGVENNSILFAGTCDGGGTLALSCDQTGLCLKK